MIRKQRLELTWIGKENRPKLEPRILMEEAEKSYHAAHRVTNGDHFDNRLIYGDNLLALKALEQEFSGKIKCIYIDPPYNKGSDFIYNDDYVDKEDSYRHSKWLSFMNKRLRLAKELLKEEGVIFISIDDTEHSKLRLLCEEIFGEKNIVGDISVVNNLKGRSDEGFFATAHEYLIVCSKNKEKAELGGFPLDEEQVAEYDLEDEFGTYKLVGLQKTG